MVAIVDNTTGTPILLYEMPRTINGLSLLFSSADIAASGNYTLYCGGQIGGNTSNWNGLFFDGTYGKGSEVGSFTTSSTVTTAGTSAGPGGGGAPGNGGGGFGPGWW